LRCKNTDCTDCRVETSRKLGCSSEFSLTYELSCGKLPARRRGDFLANLHDNPTCGNVPEVYLGAPAKCVSGFEFIFNKLKRSRIQWKICL
jgi:hypothetical protein